MLKIPGKSKQQETQAGRLEQAVMIRSTADRLGLVLGEFAICGWWRACLHVHFGVLTLTLTSTQ